MCSWQEHACDAGGSILVACTPRPQHSTTQQETTRCDTALDSTAWHRKAQHGTAQGGRCSTLLSPSTPTRILTRLCSAGTSRTAFRLHVRQGRTRVRRGRTQVKPGRMQVRPGQKWVRPGYWLARGEHTRVSPPPLLFRAASRATTYSVRESRALIVHVLKREVVWARVMPGMILC